MFKYNIQVKAFVFFKVTETSGDAKWFVGKIRLTISEGCSAPETPISLSHYLLKWSVKVK